MKQEPGVRSTFQENSVTQSARPDEPTVNKMARIVENSLSPVFDTIKEAPWQILRGGEELWRLLGPGSTPGLTLEPVPETSAPTADESLDAARIKNSLDATLAKSSATREDSLDQIGQVRAEMSRLRDYIDSTQSNRFEQQAARQQLINLEGSLTTLDALVKGEDQRTEIIEKLRNDASTIAGGSYTNTSPELRNVIATLSSDRKDASAGDTTSNGYYGRQFVQGLKDASDWTQNNLYYPKVLNPLFWTAATFESALNLGGNSLAAQQLKELTMLPEEKTAVRVMDVTTLAQLGLSTTFGPIGNALMNTAARNAGQLENSVFLNGLRLTPANDNVIGAKTYPYLVR